MQNIKNAIDEVTQLKKEFGAKRQEIVDRFDHLGAIGLVSFSGYRVQLGRVESIKNIDDDITVVERNDSDYPYQLEVFKDDITFFTLLDQAEYEEFMDGEEQEGAAPVGVTSDEVAMRDSGHKLSDFE